MTPADLINDKHCTSTCLIAGTKHRKCRCFCLGRYHGLLHTADVTTLVDLRRVTSQHHPKNGDTT